MNQDIQKQLNRIEGQIRGISKMVREDRGCTSILQQIVSVRSSLSSVGVKLLKKDLTRCAKNGEEDSYEILLENLFKIS